MSFAGAEKLLVHMTTFEGVEAVHLRRFITDIGRSFRSPFDSVSLCSLAHLLSPKRRHRLSAIPPSLHSPHSRRRHIFLRRA